MISANFLDELRGRTPLHSLIGRKARLTRKGRTWQGCCPFHSEKTPSFYVYDDHFHCFGCGAHGDAIGFVMRADGADFREAVDRLAAEAGVEVPKETPQAAARHREAQSLHDVLAAAQESFVRRLHLPEGADGLAYLRRRGLSDETIAKFGLGWSGAGRGTLSADLRSHGITAEQMLAAGLLVEREGRAADLFFNRVTFPIRDRRGRVVSFGGRVLGDAKPKYVNGGDSAVYSKRRSLYGWDLAREAVFRGAQAVVVEGNLDVIALHQAGFGGTVAPLGTALTPEQLQILWEMHPEPVLCFDGDAAGAKAASKVVETILPLLAPGFSIRIATLPGGQDPDDFIKANGPEAFGALLRQARPMHEALYSILEGVLPAGTPETRAQLRHRLESACRQIRDRSLSDEYRRALMDRFRASVRPSIGGRTPTVRRYVRPSPSPAATRTTLARIVLSAAAHHPAVLEAIEEDLSLLDLPEGACLEIRDELLRSRAVSAEGLAWLKGPEIPLEAGPDVHEDEAVQLATQIVTRLRSEVALQQDLEDAQEALVAGDPGAQARIIHINRELLAMRAGEPLEDAQC